jgi:hypothetical protein
MKSVFALILLVLSCSALPTLSVVREGNNVDGEERPAFKRTDGNTVRGLESSFVSPATGSSATVEILTQRPPLERAGGHEGLPARPTFERTDGEAARQVTTDVTRRPASGLPSLPGLPPPFEK